MAIRRAVIFAGLARALAIASLVSLTACDSAEDRAAEHYERGLELKKDGEPVKAALEFRNAIQLDDALASAHFEYGLLLSDKGEIAQAARHFLATLDTEPEHVSARSALAQIMLMSGRLDDALTQSTAAVKIAPDNPDILALHATVSYRVGERDAAVENAQKAVALQPGHPVAGAILVADKMEEEGPAEALPLLDSFIEANADDPEQARGLHLLKLGILSEGDDPEAIKNQLGVMISLYPNEANFRRALAAWHVENGSLDEAEAQLRSIADLNPNDARAASELVDFLIEHKGVEAGRAELESRIGRAEDPFPLRFNLALLNHETGRSDEAEATLRALIEEETGEEGSAERLAAARIQLARFLAARDDAEGARALVEQALAADAKNVDALTLRAAFQLDDGAPEQAVETLRAALAESPNDASLLRLAAAAYERDGRPELAREALSSAIEISGYDPEHVLSYAALLRRTDDLQTAETVLAEAARRAPKNREILTELARVRLDLQHWVEAEAAAEALREFDEASFDADRILAAALSGRKRYDESIEILTGLAQRAGGQRETLRDLVGVLLSAGKRDQARAEIDKALAADPEDSQALLLRGSLDRLDGQADAAETAFRAAIAAAPDSAEAYGALISLLEEQNRLDEAEAVAREGVEAVERPSSLRLQLALILERKGDISATLEQYALLYDAEPTSVVVANNYASLLSDHRAEDPESVELAVRVARRLRASDVPAFQDTYGWTQYLRGDYEDAEKSLRRAADGLPSNPWVRYHLGMTYAKLGETAKARAELEAAESLAGEDFRKIEAVRAALASLPEASGQPSD